MKSPMLPSDHHTAVQRVLHLGRSGRPEALQELIELLKRPSNEVQRLSASAKASGSSPSIPKTCRS